MEAMRVKGREVIQVPSQHGLNLNILEEKVVLLIGIMKALKEENFLLKNKNKDLQGELKALEGSLVSETRDLEELSQEKMMTKMVVDNLLNSIEKLIETQER